MSSTNALLKAIDANHQAVVYALDATDLVQESMHRIGAWPPATKHLGQAMMASLLLQALSEAEDRESISLQWMCQGPFGHCYVESKNYGECRGTIQNPRPPVDDYETRLGSGLLQVRRTKRGHSTTSVVSSTGDISTDIVEYLEKSEQKNCGINFSVLIDWDEKDPLKFRVVSALAYLIHILPQATEQKLNEALLRWNGQMTALGPISRWGLRPGSQTLDMIRLITSEGEPQVVMNQRVAFACNCSEERAVRALALLETQEKKEGSFSPKAETEIRCEYCGRTYTLKDAKGPARHKKKGKK